MTSILRRVSVLKISYKFTIKPVLSKCCLVHSQKLCTQQCINRSLSFGACDCILPICMKQFGGFLKEGLSKSVPLTPLSILKMRRSIGTKVSSKKYKPFRQVDGKEKSKKDRICSEECITVKFEKVKKKVKKDDIKCIVNVNDAVHEMVKQHACRKMEQINKVRNFIFKPTNCTSCMQKARRSIDKFDPQKRSFSVSTEMNKIRPKNINKKIEIKQFGLSLKNENILYPFFSHNKIRNKQTMFISDSSDFTKGGIVPLYLLVKSSSRRNKTAPSLSINFQYRVGTNHAFVPLEQRKTSENLSKNSKNYILSPTKSNDSFFKNYPIISVDKEDTSVRIKPKNEVKSKLQENFIKPLSENIIYNDEKMRKDQELNAVLEDTVKKFLIPLLQKEHLKYSEVKKAIERLEKKMESFLEKQSTIPDGNINRSLSNLCNLLMRQTQYDPKKEKIKDPIPHTEIREPSYAKESVKEPHILNCSITLPPLSKNQISDPYRNILFECKTKNNNYEDRSGNKKSSNHLKTNCEKEKDEENNKTQKAMNKSDDECKKKEKDDIHGKETEKPDPCQKREKDTGKKLDDTCNKEKVAESVFMKVSKMEEPCKKEDPCKKIGPNNQTLKNPDEHCLKIKQEKEDPCQNILKPKYHEFFSKTEAKDSCLEEDTCKTAETCKTKTTCADNSMSTSSVKQKHATVCSQKNDDKVTEIYRQKDRPCVLDVAEVCSAPASEQLDRNHKSQISSVSKRADINKKCEEGKPMGPSEVICEKKDTYVPKDCCKEVDLCGKTSIRVMEPKCLGNQHVPSPDDGKHLEENSSPGKYIPTPVQKPCGAYCHEPSEPPNSCKLRPSNKSPETFDQIKEKSSCKQTPCPPKIVPEKIVKKYEEIQSICPPSPPQFPKESFFSYSKVEKDISKLKSKRCVYEKTLEEKKEIPTGVVKKMDTNCIRTPNLQSDKKILARAPQQAQKKNWLPFKLIFGKRKLKKSKSLPTTNCPPKQDKTLNDGNVTVDNCKGFFKRVSGIFCPGKSKPKKKAGGIIRCHSLPSIIPTKMDDLSSILPGSADNGGFNKKMARFFIYNMKVKHKYPWNQTQRKVSKYFTTNFSTNSHNALSPRVHVLDTANVQIQKVIKKRTKSKTMLFRLVLQKNVNGFTTDPFGNKNMPQCFRYIQLLESQKRKYSDISANKLNFKRDHWNRNTIKDKGKRINHYMWRTFEGLRQILRTYECCIAKKLFKVLSTKLSSCICYGITPLDKSDYSSFSRLQSHKKICDTP